MAIMIMNVMVRIIVTTYGNSSIQSLVEVEKDRSWSGEINSPDGSISSYNAELADEHSTIDVVTQTPLKFLANHHATGMIGGLDLSTGWSQAPAYGESMIIMPDIPNACTTIGTCHYKQGSS